MPKKSPQPTDVHVGSRIRSRRMFLGLSQEKLGDALQLTFQQVQKYEKGANRVGASRLQEIARILKVEVGYFFEGQGGSSQRTEDDVAYVREFNSSREGLALMRAFMTIPKSARIKVVAVVELLSAAFPKTQ